MISAETVHLGKSARPLRESIEATFASAQQEIVLTFQTNTDQLSRATLPVASLLLEASDSMLEEEQSRSLHTHIDTLVVYELVAQELWVCTVKTGPKSLEQTTSMVREQLEHLQQNLPHTADAVFESATVTVEDLLNRRLFPSRIGQQGSDPSPALDRAKLSPWEKMLYSQRFIAAAVATHRDRLEALRGERPDLVRQIDKIVTVIADSALENDAFHQGRRFHNLGQAVHSVGLATRGSSESVSRAFEAVTVSDPSGNYEMFRKRLFRCVLSKQVNVLEGMLVGKKDIADSVQRWEHALSGLFKSNSEDRDFYQLLSDRDKATLVVLAMQNDLGMQAKVKRLLEMPETTRLLVELATTKAADRFTGWGEAARVAALIHNESTLRTSQQISLSKKLIARAANVFYSHGARQPGAGDGGSRPPRKPNWGYIGFAGTVLISMACGIISQIDGDGGSLPPPGISTHEPTIGPTPQTSISPDAMTAIASATSMVDATMIGPAPSMIIDAFRYAPINNGEIGISPVTQQWLKVIAGVTNDSAIQASLQASSLWADARAHCKDASSCMVATASYTEPGNPNASRTAYFLRAPDGFILAASTNSDGSINTENSRWLPPLVARDGTQLVPYEVFNYGARTDGCQIFPAPPADQRRLVWATPDGRVVAHQTLFGNGLAELVVINHAVLFGDNKAFRDVCGKAFAARALNDGTLVGAYYPVGADGNVLFSNPTDADGKINKFATFNPKTGEWLWKDGPLPTSTPEPTATPAEIVIGCNDSIIAKQVFDEFKRNNDVDSLLNYRLDKTFSIGANWITVDFKALHVGTYKVSLEGKEVGGQIAGENSYATCVVLAAPSFEEPLNVVSTVVVNGKRVWRSLVFNQVIDDPSVVADHIAREKGSLLDFQVLFAVDEPGWPIFKPFNYLKDKNDLSQTDASDIDLEALARTAKENNGLGLALFDVRNR